MTPRTALAAGTDLPPVASQPTGPAAANTAGLDEAEPALARALRVDAVHRLLAAVDAQPCPRADQHPASPTLPPQALRAIAAAVVDAGTPIPALPGIQRLVADAVSRARADQELAHAGLATAERAFAEFLDDLRRRATTAVNESVICGSGTDTALREWGIPPLQQEYRVRLQVTVRVAAPAYDEDAACAAAQGQVRAALLAADIDTDAVEPGHAISTGRYLDH